MLHRRGWLIACALTLLVPTVTQAQPPGGGRGGPGGRGMFGGGGSLGLLRMEEVQKELAVTEAQKEQVTKLADELRPQGGGGIGGFQDLSQEERQKRFAEMQKQMAETAKKADEKLKTILDEKQYTRLSELRLQREGVDSLSRPEVADKLGLSEDQKKKIGDLAAASRPRFGGGPGGGGGAGGPPNFEEMRAQREKAQADILAVLTPDQKTTYEKMQGTKFEFPQRGFGGPGGPGGGGNRPRRPANE